MKLAKSKLSISVNAGLYLAFSLGTISSQAIAADQSRGYTGIDEVVVTARRREERLQDVPVAITAIDSRMMQQRGISNTEDLMGAMPNVQISSFVGSSTPNITVRAIGVGNEFNASAVSPVGVYIDEDYVSFRPAHGMQFFDLERVEVVKGPQGTLYGRNTTGGAVNVISKVPTLSADTEGYVKAGIGNYNAWNIEGASELTLIEDKLGIRVAGIMSKADGIIDNVTPLGVGLTNDDYAETDSSSARVTVRYQPTEDLDFVLKTYWGETDPTGMVPLMRSILPTGGDVSGYSRESLGKYESQANGAGPMIVETKGATLRTTINVGEATITSVTGFSNSDYSATLDCDGGINSICFDIFRSEIDQFNQDLRINFDGDNWKAVLGMYYGKEELASNNNINYFGFIDDFFPGLPFNPPIPSPESLAAGLFDPSSPITGIYAYQVFDQEVTSKALYGEFGFELTDKWELTFGLRYTEDETDYNNALTTLSDADGVVRAGVIPFSYPFDASAGYFAQQADGEDVSGRIILDYKINEDAHVYTSYSRGYRAGTFNGFAYQSVEQIYFVEPETVDAWELGWKSQFGDNRFQFNGAIFFYDYENQQVQEILGSIAFLRSISGEVTGAELEFIAQVTPDLTVNASMGVLDTEYNKDQVIGSTDVGGNEWPFAPESTFNIHADWTIASFDYGSLTLVPEAQYSGSYYYDIFNVSRRTQDDYWLFNARLTFEHNSGYAVSLWGKNLGDKYYEPWGADTGDFGADYFVRGKPRMYGLEATYRF